MEVLEMFKERTEMDNIPSIMEEQKWKMIKIINVSKIDLPRIDDHGYDASKYTGWDDLQREISKDYNIGHITPLYLKIREENRYLTTIESESSEQIGFVVVTKEDIYDSPLATHRITHIVLDKIETMIQIELSKYNKLLNHFILHSKTDGSLQAS